MELSSQLVIVGIENRKNLFPKVYLTDLKETIYVYFVVLVKVAQRVISFLLLGQEDQVNLLHNEHVQP